MANNEENKLHFAAEVVLRFESVETRDYFISQLTDGDGANDCTMNFAGQPPQYIATNRVEVFDVDVHGSREKDQEWLKEAIKNAPGGILAEMRRSMEKMKLPGGVDEPHG